MPRICAITGRKPVRGKSYSLRGIAKKKKGVGLKITGISRRMFNPNLVKKRFWLAEEKRYVKMRVSTNAIKTIEKHGLKRVLSDIRSKKELVQY